MKNAELLKKLNVIRSKASCAKIADELMVSKTTVWRWLAFGNIPLCQQKRHCEKINELYLKHK